jgi:hypothetical protein
MILTLARGHYCPREHQQHLELAANYPKIAVAYTQVVTIATDEHHTLQEFRASVGTHRRDLREPGPAPPPTPAAGGQRPGQPMFMRTAMPSSSAARPRSNWRLRASSVIGGMAGSSSPRPAPPP